MKYIIAMSAIIFVVVTPNARAQNRNGARTPAVDTTPKPLPPVVGRLSWTSDRRPVRVGDLLTIVVDEQTAASESNNAAAHLNRAQTGTLNTELAPAKLRSVGIGYDAASDAGSQAGRSGNLTAILSVRVTAVEPNGIARVKGQKHVLVDGRAQDVLLEGIVRSEDVTPDNTVRSERVADAVITYKGKKLAPTTGIFGKILAILWP